MLASSRQLIVLGTKILSPIKIYVNMAKITLDTPKPISFEAHNSPVDATILLIAYQKHIPIGIAKIKLDKNGLLAHHSHIN